MNSIRTKMTLLTVCAIIVSLLIATLLGISAIRRIGIAQSDQTLTLLCEAGQKNLNSYFESVEQSVEMVSAYLEKDLEEMDGLDEEQLRVHLLHARDIFDRMARKTNGVLTYYYRIDPEVSTQEKGFWYVDLDGEGFQEHEPTDISLYDTGDTSVLVWFTVPKATGQPVWQPPYITDNLGVRVLSYNRPIYWEGEFIGVAGIEIDYRTMAQTVDHITLYENGYAFINDAEGTIIYHPRMDVLKMETQPTVPEGLLGPANTIHYTFEGVEKQAVWLPLSNGMRLNVTVPTSEINAGWRQWNYEILALTVVLLAIFVSLSLRITGHITRPLRELTEVAERVNRGEYDCRLTEQGDDEVGILTRAFNKLTAHLQVYIHNLNDLAYADALTGVHNKGAFDLMVQGLEEELQETGQQAEFAICMFDCNNLKKINDTYGHDKGNLYLTAACKLICEIFDHSSVFRLGGDEFGAILRNSDYANRDALLASFDAACARSQAEPGELWEKVDVARGMAAYDRENDQTVEEVVRRADKLMYENKFETKGLKSSATS